MSSKNQFLKNEFNIKVCLETNVEYYETKEKTIAQNYINSCV
jgi:hypothetical protein